MLTSSRVRSSLPSLLGRASRTTAHLLVAVAVAAGCAGDAGPPATPQIQSAADNGSCALPAGLCGGACVDLTSAPAHCGACGNACAAGAVCSRGACAPGCGAGLTTCGAACVDVQSDPSNCGACGASCPSESVCSRGTCTASGCAEELTACGRGACRNLLTDAYNCGACGRVCLAGEACVAGACALPTVCALGTATSTTAVVDLAQLSSTGADVLPTAVDAGVGQTVTVDRLGFLSGVEVSLTTCGGALTGASTVQLTVRDSFGQTLASSSLARTAVVNGTCPNTPPGLGAGARGRVVFGFGSTCVPVAPGQRLTFLVSAVGATTTGTCPSGAAPRRCANDPSVVCTASAQCANLPARVLIGRDAAGPYAGGTEVVAGVPVASTDLAFKTYVTPYVTHCGGQTSCSTGCRDLTSDLRNCGACNRACGSTTPLCSAGVCVTACGAGLSTCPALGATPAHCANLQSDNRDCGACGSPCATGQVCAMGTCVTTCAVGQTLCGAGATARCAETTTDNANCGLCGRACPAGTACSGGACVVSCQVGLTNCGGLCRDLATDRGHCGGCNTPCSSGQVCSAGSCVASCGPGLSACAGACRDLQGDRNNCGACGNVCPGGMVCSSGRCAGVCGAGQSICSGTCRDLQNDPVNCGTCDNVCSLLNATAGCSTGACSVASCAPGFGNCDGNHANGCEANLSTEMNNCGACGNACLSGQTCIGGACLELSARSYTEYFVSGVIPSTQCANWQTFINGLSTYGEVHLSGTFDTAGISCSDPVVVNRLAAALRTRESFSGLCDGHTWSTCGRYEGEIWIDPPELCSNSNCPNPGRIIRPCIGTPNWGGVDTAVCGPPSQSMTLTFLSQ